MFNFEKKYQYEISEAYHVTGSPLSTLNELIEWLEGQSYQLDREEETGYVVIKKLDKKNQVLFEKSFVLPFPAGSNVDQLCGNFRTKKVLPSEVEPFDSEYFKTPQEKAARLIQSQVQTEDETPVEIVKEKQEEPDSKPEKKAPSVQAQIQEAIAAMQQKFEQEQEKSQKQMQVLLAQKDAEIASLKPKPLSPSTEKVAEEKHEMPSQNQADVERPGGDDKTEENVPSENRLQEVKGEKLKLLASERISPSAMPEALSMSPQFLRSLGLKEKEEVMQEVTLAFAKQKEIELQHIQEKIEDEKIAAIEAAQTVFDSAKAQALEAAETNLLVQQKDLEDRYDQTIFAAFNDKMKAQNKIIQAYSEQLKVSMLRAVGLSKIE